MSFENGRLGGRLALRHHGLNAGADSGSRLLQPLLFTAGIGRTLFAQFARKSDAFDNDDLPLANSVTHRDAEIAVSAGGLQQARKR